MHNSPSGEYMSITYSPSGELSRRILVSCGDAKPKNANTYPYIWSLRISIRRSALTSPVACVVRAIQPQVVDVCDVNCIETSEVIAG
jgi:hypothetical protein